MTEEYGGIQRPSQAQIARDADLWAEEVARGEAMLRRIYERGRAGENPLSDAPYVGPAK